VAKIDDPDAVIRESAAIVSVAVLPFAHAPFRCEAPFSGDDPRRTDGIIGDTRLCSYHQPNWRRIADASVAARKQTGPWPTSDALLSALSFDGLSTSDREWLYWLIADPIVWRPGADRVTNGQHRICALRAADVPRVIVDTS
jgi:hypothetical protein